MVRWSVLPALLLAALFLAPATLVSDSHGRDGLVLTAQVEGQQLALVAFSPFCVVVKIGDSDYGVTTSYLIRRVQLGDSPRFDTASSNSLILNPRGREDVRVPMTFGQGPLRARLEPLAFAAIGAPLESAADTG